MKMMFSHILIIGYSVTSGHFFKKDKNGRSCSLLDSAVDVRQDMWLVCQRIS